MVENEWKIHFFFSDTEWLHFLMPFHFTMFRAVVAAGFEVWALITVIIGHKSLIYKRNWTDWSAIWCKIILWDFKVKHSITLIWNHKYVFRPKLHDMKSRYGLVMSILKSQNSVAHKRGFFFFLSVYKYFIDPVEWGFEESCRSCRSFSRNFIGFFKKSLKIWLVVIFWYSFLIGWGKDAI